MDTFEAIRTVRAVREYEDRAIPEEVKLRILKAARWTGSSKNFQPWSFIVVQDRAKLNWLAHSGDYAEHLRHAALAIVIVTERGIRAGAFDSGRCAQNIMVAAWNEGVGSCIASMHRQREAELALELPPEYEVQTVIALGYPAPGPARSPRKEGRKPMEELLHWDRW